MPKYEEYRSSIKTGDTLVWKTVNWKSAVDWFLQLVRLALRTEYTHVGIAFVVGGRVLVVEATYPKVRIYPLSKMRPFYHIGLNLPWDDSKTDILLENVGDEYSVLQAISAYFGEPKDDRLWECAELAKRIYAKLGLDIKSDFTPSGLVDNLLSYSQTGLVKVE